MVFHDSFIYDRSTLTPAEKEALYHGMPVAGPPRFFGDVTDIDAGLRHKEAEVLFSENLTSQLRTFSENTQVLQQLRRLENNGGAELCQ